MKTPGEQVKSTTEANEAQQLYSANQALSRLVDAIRLVKLGWSCFLITFVHSALIAAVRQRGCSLGIDDDGKWAEKY